MLTPYVKLTERKAKGNSKEEGGEWGERERRERERVRERSTC